MQKKSYTKNYSEINGNVQLILFRWLLQEYKAPDHATISRFHKDYLSNEVIEELFYQQVKYLAAYKEILFENVFIDGTKIEANANRYTFVWKKSIYKNEEKMFNFALFWIQH